MFTRVLSIQGPGFGRSNQRPDVHTGASYDLLLLSEFGPDQMPVVRTKVATRKPPLAEFLDLNAPLFRDCA